MDYLEIEADVAITSVIPCVCINSSPVFDCSYLAVYRIEQSLQRGTIFCFMWAGCRGKLALLLEISHFKTSPPQQVESLPPSC